MSSPTADRGPLPLRGGVPIGMGAKDIQRRRVLRARWKRRSLLVQALRRLLPALCLVILVALAGWAGLNTLFWRLGAGAQGGGLTIRMLKPNFQGRNAAGKPFVLTADSAVRDDKDAARVTMVNPVFIQGSTGLDRTQVKSKIGVYREDTRMLDLRGQVELDDANGYHFATEHALVDTVKNNVDGEGHIEGHGPMGRIQASRYAVRNGGASVYFTGQVKTRIEHGAQAARPGTAAPPETVTLK